MIRGFVEPSGESDDLARAEVAAASRALGGRLLPSARGPRTEVLEVELPGPDALQHLAARLALARRVLLLTAEGPDLETTARREGGSGLRAAFRRLGRPGAPADETVRTLGREYVAGGGAIDLEYPTVRYWLLRVAPGVERLMREVAEVDRPAVARRALPRLPFRRPVALPPRLARAAVNLASTRAGARVLDPFLGTGALLAEAALLGAKVYGIDADAAMVRGALRNFVHLGVQAEALVVGDSATVAVENAPTRFDAIITDPPYGRSSASVGAEPERLVPAVLARWAKTVAEDGAVVVVAPGGPPTLPDPWVETVRVPVRVHRSLTREFRVYRRAV